jgi:hypothetical protein
LTAQQGILIVADKVKGALHALGVKYFHKT